MIDKEIREVLLRRMAFHPEDSFATEKCWEEEINVLCRDIDQTIDFINNRCTGEEFVWLSEVFEEVQEQTHSEKFRQCLLDVTQKYPNETKEYSILEFISPPEENEI